ncbi:MAG TPA: alpha/beta hydrolase [Parvularcula sp.]|nr:alpha/beta hydrolase [Parvularcula sp.]HBS35383.1 alpha/beta hydrolase [Parvularcula sp.]
MQDDCRETGFELEDGVAKFAVTTLAGGDCKSVALFAVGRGGDPARHSPLLRRLARGGRRVIAPHFDMLASAYPRGEDLSLRARRLELALHALTPPELPVFGIGHSIGATTLLILAGASARTIGGDIVRLNSRRAFTKLMLLAPATDFFRAPHSLDQISVPIHVWAGTQDAITPPAQAIFLERELSSRMSVDVRLVEGADHFAFMDHPPPKAASTGGDRARILEAVSGDLENLSAA